MTNLAELNPDIKISINQIFGINTDMKVDGFSKKRDLSILIVTRNYVKKIRMHLELWSWNSLLIGQLYKKSLKLL